MLPFSTLTYVGRQLCTVCFHELRDFTVLLVILVTAWNRDRAKNELKEAGERQIVAWFGTQMGN